MGVLHYKRAPKVERGLAFERGCDCRRFSRQRLLFSRKAAEPQSRRAAENAEKTRPPHLRLGLWPQHLELRLGSREKLVLGRVNRFDHGVVSNSGIAGFGAIEQSKRLFWILTVQGLPECFGGGQPLGE